MASRQWTEQHSIDLIEAYIGAEVERSPKGEVWIGGDEWHIPLPDMSKDGGWLMRCLESWLKCKRPGRQQYEPVLLELGYMDGGVVFMEKDSFGCPEQSLLNAIAWFLFNEIPKKEKESK